MPYIAIGNFQRVIVVSIEKHVYLQGELLFRDVAVASVWGGGGGGLSKGEMEMALHCVHFHS